MYRGVKLVLLRMGSVWMLFEHTICLFGDTILMAIAAAVQMQVALLVLPEREYQLIVT
jgi:hypothetical protein